MTGESSIAGQKYQRMATYETSLVDGKGTFTPGTASTYVGAQWSVKPGDRLIVDYINALADTRFQPMGDKKVRDVPTPLNLHTHGLTVSPSGNGDNVLLSIPQGRSNRFDIKIPATQYHGLYWYHPHIHGITDEQIYNGLAGHIVVGRADGDYKPFDGLKVHPMMIRYNVRDPGTDGGDDDHPSDKDELIDASPYDTTGTGLKAAAKEHPGGKMIYTVNGQLRPRIKIRAARAGAPAESQVWAMTNITGSATYIVALDEVAAADADDPAKRGTPVDFTIVSHDGTPMPRPIELRGEAARRGYLLGQGGRVAILAQGPSDPSKVVRLIQVENRSGTGDASAFDARTEVGDKQVEPHFIGGWRDYNQDVLAIGEDDPGSTRPHVDTPQRLETNYGVHAAKLDTVDHKRTFIFNGVDNTPNEFPVNGELFGENRVDQPKAGTVEEWTILNYSSLHHPFHVHTQYGKVMEIDAPRNDAYKDPPGQFESLQYVTDLNQPKPALWTQDVVNLPPAKVDSVHGMPAGEDGKPVGKDGVPAQPGKIVLRLRFEDYLGTYVEHCHRLPHEDRGMMSLVRTIPHDPAYAVTSPSADGQRVTVYGSSDDKIVRSFVPFGRTAASVSTAFGDVDGDAVPDLAVASGRGMSSAVEVFSGASRFERRIARLAPFQSGTAGVTVALGDLNADGRDDIVTGLADGSPRVRIFDGETGRRLADFNAFDGDDYRGGVSVATGMLEAGGRISLVAGAGPGGPPTVRVFNFDLFGDADGNFPDIRAKLDPLAVATFAGAPGAERGGVDVATADPYAASGGFSNVLVTPRSGGGKTQIFTIGQSHGHGMVDVSTSGVARPITTTRPRGGRRPPRSRWTSAPSAPSRWAASARGRARGCW